MRTRIWIRPTGSRPDVEREFGGPVGLGQGTCYNLNLKSSCTCWTDNCSLRLLYFYGICPGRGAGSACWMAHGLFNHTSAGNSEIDD